VTGEKIFLPSQPDGRNKDAGKSINIINCGETENSLRRDKSIDHQTTEDIDLRLNCDLFLLPYSSCLHKIF